MKQTAVLSSHQGGEGKDAAIIPCLLGGIKKNCFPPHTHRGMGEEDLDVVWRGGEGPAAAWGSAVDN